MSALLEYINQAQSYDKRSKGNAHRGVHLKKRKDDTHIENPSKNSFSCSSVVA